MSVTNEKILSILKQIAENEDLINFEHTFSAGSNKGDNFVGEITRVQISGKKSNGNDGKLDLILKCGASTAKRRKEFINDLLFENETYYYEKLAPKYLNFQTERGLSVDLMFTSYPKCFDAICNADTEEYMLVFENLKEQEYEMWPKNKPNPIENTRMVVQALAKFHAVSFAMKDQQPHVFDQFKQLKDLMTRCIKTGNTRQMFTASYTRTIDLLDDPKHIEIYKHLTDNLEIYADDLFDENNLGKFGVVGHGDCWNNNIMYHKSKVR